jgi:hypothetical protein
VRAIARSIDAFGFNAPILVDKCNQIVAGHGRYEAAQLLGLERIPVISLDHLTEAQARAYLLADNKLAERSSWDDVGLAIHGFQCGYCTPGQICSAVGMAAELRKGVPSYVTADLKADAIALSHDELRERMSGNLCRCGAYNGIVDAIHGTFGDLATPVPKREAA